MANIFAAEIARIQEAIQITRDNIARDQALLAQDPTNERLKTQIASGQAYLVDLDAQLAFFGAQNSLPVASAGNLARDDQLATAPGSLPQAPNGTAQVLTPDGRIATVPDTTSGTNAVSPVNESTNTNTPNVDTGTDAPVRTIQQTQSTPAYGPGLLLNPGDAEAQAGGYYGGVGGPATPPASTQIGVGAGNDDTGTTPNLTRQEINSIFNNAVITPQSNVLDQYASYTYGISVYLTSEEAYKTMVTTGKKNLSGSHLLFQSAGIPVGSRTPYFNNDYYIEKVDLHSKIIGKATGMTHNVVDFNMTVVEPTGITLIDNLTKAIQTLLPGANVKKNLSSVVYFMVIRFYGYDQFGNLVRGAPGGLNSANMNTDTNAFVEKFFPFLIKDIKFKVGNKIVEYDITAAGVHYTINAGSARGSIPYNIELSGQTVNDLLSGAAQYTAATQNSAGTTVTDLGNVVPPLAPPKASAAPPKKATIRQGLIDAINAFQRELCGPGADCPYTYPDVYSVEFATPALKSAKVRKPGTLNKSATSNATVGTAADQKLGAKQSMDADSRTQSATAGMQIVQLLDQIMRNSTYLEDQQLVKYDEQTQQLMLNGTPAQSVAWFKISLQATPMLDKYDPKRNDYAYNIKYTISPYRIAQLNSQYFPRPAFTGVQKEYNYWFTGQNTSVLNYEESINNLYYLTLSGVNFSNNGTVIGNNDEQLKYNFNTRSTESSQGADGKTNEPVANAAEQLLNPGDFKESTITIVGDPAWIQQGEAFVGRPIGSSDYFSAFLADGTINFDAGQVLYRISFNASSDYDLDTGLQTISGTASGSSGNGIGITPLTSQPGGPAAINRTFVAKECISSFSKGKFTQQLKGSMLLNATTADNQAAASAASLLQKQAISALSLNRQGSSVTAALGALSTTAWATSITGVTQALTTAGVNFVAQNVLGGQSTKSSAIPGLPTSSGQAIGTAINNVFAPPARLTGSVNTPGFNPNGNQQSQAGVVDTVSNGTTQVVAASDDAGDAITKEYLAAANNNAPNLLDSPVSTPTDLGDFYG